MIKFQTILFAFSFISINLMAQTYGILPFTGIKYTENGLSAKKIDVDLAEYTWTSNRLPINTKFVIDLKEPKGLIADENGYFHPGCEVLILDIKKGDSLGYAENIFQNGEGLNGEDLNSLSLTLGFNDKVSPGDSLQVYVRFYDLSSKNEIVFDFPVVIVTADLKLENTRNVHNFKSYTGYEVRASGVEIDNVMCKLESESKTSHHRVSMKGISFITQQEFENGTLSCVLYDAEMKELKIKKGTEIQFVPNQKDPNSFDLIVKIPINTKSKEMLKSSVRVRWESEDHTKVIDAFQIQRAI